VYDVSRRETFDNLKEIWLREVDMYSSGGSVRPISRRSWISTWPLCDAALIRSLCSAGG
jgi:hypothetical protein